MDEPIATDPPELAAKIARLVEERGWNQEEFARIARVNRHTARQILLGSADRSLRNSTILACARALGLSVSDLRTRPLDKLLPLMRDAQPSDGEAGLRRLHDQATQPELVAWLERNPDRRGGCRQRTATNCWPCKARRGRSEPSASRVSCNAWKRRRKIVERIHAIAGTEYLDLLEQIVDLIHDRVQPGQRRPSEPRP